jgi:putative flavoprotein involved in K+ transport
VDRADEDGLWRLETSSGPLLARYAVLATGYDAVPKLPEWADNGWFAGELIHASEYRSAKPYRGREVLVVGAGNTGIDIAGLLVEAGARVSLAMRTPPNVFPRDWHGIPLQPSAIPAERLPAKIGDALGFAMQRLIYGDLSPYGIPRSPDGFQTKFRRQLVGPAVDDGFIAALRAGRTRVVASVERLEVRDVVLVDGTRMQPDSVICATGYARGLEPIAGLDRPCDDRRWQHRKRMDQPGYSGRDDLLGPNRRCRPHLLWRPEWLLYWSRNHRRGGSEPGMDYWYQRCA